MLGYWQNKSKLELCIPISPTLLQTGSFWQGRSFAEGFFWLSSSILDDCLMWISLRVFILIHRGAEIAPNAYYQEKGILCDGRVRKPSVIIYIQWKPFLWVGESNASTHTCCMHTSTSWRNAHFCIWEQLLSEMERPTDGCIVIVGGGREGSYFGFPVECVSVCKCLTGCVLYYLDLSGVIKGSYSPWILERG